MFLLSILSEILIQCSSSILSILMFCPFTTSWIFWIFYVRKYQIQHFWPMCPSLLLLLQCLRFVFHFCILSVNLASLVPMCTPKLCFQLSLILCFLHCFFFLVSNNLFPSTLDLFFVDCIYRIYWFPPLFCLCFSGCLLSIY